MLGTNTPLNVDQDLTEVHRAPQDTLEASAGVRGGGVRGTVNGSPAEGGRGEVLARGRIMSDQISVLTEERTDDVVMLDHEPPTAGEDREGGGAASAGKSRGNSAATAAAATAKSDVGAANGNGGKDRGSEDAYMLIYVRRGFEWGCAIRGGGEDPPLPPAVKVSARACVKVTRAWRHLQKRGGNWFVGLRILHTSLLCSTK